MKYNRIVITIIVVGIVLRLICLLWAKGTMVDDAYISLRYAHNLIEGKGLVYNEGHRVLGVSGPIYPVFMAPFLLLSPAIESGYTIGLANIICFAISALIFFNLSQELGKKTTILILLLFSTHVRFVDNSIIGMETPLFLLGMAVCLLLLARNRNGWLSLLLGLLVLIRPEGVLWIFSIFIVLIVRRQKLRLIEFLPGALVLLFWVIFSVWYYGSPVPQSVLAKSGWIVPISHQAILSRVAFTFTSLSLLDVPGQLAQVMLIRAAIAAIAVVLIILFYRGIRTLFIKRSVFLALPLLFLAYFVFYLVGRGRLDFSWYGIPSGLGFIVGVSAGIGSVARSFGSGPALDRWFRILVPMVAIVLIITDVIVWRTTRLQYYRTIRESYEQAAIFIDQNAAGDASILVDEIGMIGYRGKRFVYDLGGLVSPEIVKYRAANEWDLSCSDIMRKFKPDFFVISPPQLNRLLIQEDTEWISINYAIVSRFPKHVVLQRIQ